MKRMLFAALAMLAWPTLAAAEPARVAQADESGTLPPHDVVDIVRSEGFEPLGQPIRRGPNYVLRAIDDYDREVRVVVHARSGEIVSVTPVTTASRVPPGGSLGPYQRMSPTYVPPPPPGYRGAPIIDEDEEPIYGRPPAPVPNGPPPSYSSRPQSPSATRRDLVPDDEAPASAPGSTDSSKVPPPGGSREGLLPPPPDRFPQRAPASAASTKTKPATRAAAVPPKNAPLPKPRPARAEPPPAAAQPSPAAPPASPPPAADETPH